MAVKRSEHVEYQRHREHLDTAARYRQIVIHWQENGEPLAPGREPAWTPASARALLTRLMALFTAYNRVLWQQFPYCRNCLGGCCVVDATDLKPFDYVALALLGDPLPERPTRSPVDPRACIYLTPAGCSWPTRWRPLKCAAFYCLGSGDWRLDEADQRFGEITTALQQVTAASLPAETATVIGEQLLALLGDPVAFAEALAQQVTGPFIAALHQRYPELAKVAGEVQPNPEQGATAQEHVTADALDFIARAVTSLLQASDGEQLASAVAAEQFLADLETLEWILRGRPAQEATLLATLYERYTQALPSDDSLTSLSSEMAAQLRILQERLYE